MTDKGQEQEDKSFGGEACDDKAEHLVGLFVEKFKESYPYSEKEKDAMEVTMMLALQTGVSPKLWYEDEVSRL